MIDAGTRVVIGQQKKSKIRAGERARAAHLKVMLEYADEQPNRFV